MDVAVSLVVIGRDFRHALDALVESVDQQSLSIGAFEVVLVDQGSTDGTLERLRQLVTHRANVRLVQADVNDRADWVEACSGDYVLPVSADRVLFPEALERLHAFAVEHELHVVSARAVHPGAAVPTVLLGDSSTLDPPARAAALHGPAPSAQAVGRSVVRRLSCRLSR
jgi:poly(ribitol-phosphate) beta-N-acetylglucosaminyltransferase